MMRKIIYILWAAWPSKVTVMLIANSAELDMLCFTCVLPQKGGRVAPKAIKISSDIWKYWIFRSPDICIDMRYQSSSYLLEFLNAQQFVIFTVSLPANFLFSPLTLIWLSSLLFVIIIIITIIFYIESYKFYHWPYQWTSNKSTFADWIAVFFALADISVFSLKQMSFLCICRLWIRLRSVLPRHINY